MTDPTTLPADLPVPEDDGPLLSDAELELTRALELPTFDVDSLTLIRRLTLIVRDGVIADVVYPVFPPDRGAELALERL